MASPTAKPGFLKSIMGSSSDWIIPALAVSMVFVMVIPLPAMLG